VRLNELPAQPVSISTGIFPPFQALFYSGFFSSHFSSLFLLSKGGKWFITYNKIPDFG